MDGEVLLLVGQIIVGGLLDEGAFRHLLRGLVVAGTGIGYNATFDGGDAGRPRKLLAAVVVGCICCRCRREY